MSIPSFIILLGREKKLVAFFSMCVLMLISSCGDDSYALRVVGPPRYTADGTGTSATTGSLLFTSLPKSRNSFYTRIRVSVGNNSNQTTDQQSGFTRYSNLPPGRISFVVNRWRLREVSIGYNYGTSISLGYPAFGSSPWITTITPAFSSSPRYVLERHAGVATIKSGQTVEYVIYL